MKKNNSFSSFFSSFCVPIFLNFLARISNLALDVWFLSIDQ
jgi:hypothetical protein